MCADRPGMVDAPSCNTGCGAVTGPRTDEQGKVATCVGSESDRGSDRRTGPRLCDGTVSFVPLDRLSNPNAPTVAELESAATLSFRWVDPVAVAGSFDQAIRAMRAIAEALRRPLFTQEMLESLARCEAELRHPVEAWENEGGAL